MSEGKSEGKTGWIAGVGAVAALLAALGVNQFFPDLMRDLFGLPAKNAPAVSTPPTAAVAAQAETTVYGLRLDGIYRSPGTDSVRYLRFYNDGTVLAASVEKEGNLGEILHWFNRDGQNLSRGVYAISPQQDVEFSAKGMFGTVAYSGKVQNDQLNLHVVSRINGHTSDEQYTFMQVLGKE